MSEQEVQKQAARCMDCGIPYCHGPTGCPVHNQIPDWNDLVYNGNWDEAIRNLHSTNNFPEFTGRVCPAPCEEACTLNLEDVPVAIKTVEQAIADKAYEMGYIVPQPAVTKTGKKVAIIGSGPAGMAAAQQLARAGHEVHVYERESRPGGLLRYGIPDFKMEKNFIDRRVDQMRGEGVTFHCGVNVGVDRTVESLMADHDAVLYCGGSETPRNAGIPGVHLAGVHDPARYPPDAAGKGRQACRLAVLGNEDAHLVLPGRRSRARVPGGDARIRRRRRPADGCQMLSGR
jgi:glutamate synthase (NADPH/NADH) small chain